jgi:hypothetical protein
MAAVTLTSLVARIRERADMVGSTFVLDSATSLYAWINEANQKLHGKLVEALGEEYVSSTSVLTTVAGQADYAVPAGFFKLYGVELELGGEVTALEPYMRAERNDFRNANRAMFRYQGGDLPRYALIGSNIRLYPIPQQVFTGSILYAPEATVLAAGADTVNYPNGWERFIVLDAAIQCLAKEESSVKTLSDERAAVIAEIDLAKEQRDLANPKRVRDVTSFLGSYEVF